MKEMFDKHFEAVSAPALDKICTYIQTVFNESEKEILHRIGTDSEDKTKNPDLSPYSAVMSAAISNAVSFHMSLIATNIRAINAAIKRHENLTPDDVRGQIESSVLQQFNEIFKENNMCLSVLRCR